MWATHPLKSRSTKVTGATLGPAGHPPLGKLVLRKHSPYYIGRLNVTMGLSGSPVSMEADAARDEKGCVYF